MFFSSREGLRKSVENRLIIIRSPEILYEIFEYNNFRCFFTGEMLQKYFYTYDIIGCFVDIDMSRNKYIFFNRMYLLKYITVSPKIGFLLNHNVGDLRVKYRYISNLGDIDISSFDRLFERVKLFRRVYFYNCCVVNKNISSDKKLKKFVDKEFRGFVKPLIINIDDKNLPFQNLQSNEQSLDY